MFLILSFLSKNTFTLYYLILCECSTVVGYDSCCPMVFQSYLHLSNVSDCVPVNTELYLIPSPIWFVVRDFAKKDKFQKSEITMEVGGLVEVSLGIFWVLKIVPK